MRYKFLFAIIERRCASIYSASDRSAPPRREMYDRPMSTCYYEKQSDKRVLETREHTARLYECMSDYSQLDT